MDQKLILKKICNLWNFSYLSEKNNNGKLKRNYVQNFNPIDKYNDDWDNLQSKLQKYTKINETNG